MASIIKMTAGQVSGALRHNTREQPFPAKNEDINSELTNRNYHLTPFMTAKEAKAAYNSRLKEIYVYGRKDIITACQWCCTAPKDLPVEKEKQFFEETFNFLNSLYGSRNCVQCVVHYDEGVRDNDGNLLAGRPHLHYIFIPSVKNEKFGEMGKCGPLASSGFEEKLGANRLIRKSTLTEFHPKYQAWITHAGINATVRSGVTNGKNRTVRELKSETKSQILSQEQEWGHSSVWERKVDKSWER